MKKIFLTLLGVVLMAPSLKGQTTKTISLSFSANDFDILYDSVGSAIITSDKYDVFYSPDTLLPALPYINYNVLIGLNEDFGNITTSKSLTTFQTGIQMAQNPLLLPTSYCPQTQTNKLVYFPKSHYPSNNVIYTGIHEIDGYRFLSFSVCPFRYYPQLNRVYLYNSITLNITLDVAHFSSGYNNSPLLNMVGYNMRGRVKDIVINTGDMDAYYSLYSISDTIPDMYLIVTTEALKSSFQRLSDWKRKKGYRTTILTTEYISQHYTGETMPIRIKTALKDYYDGNNHKLKYVLLAGDIDSVPSLQCYIKYHANDTTEYIDYTPTDLYYACLGNLNWDTNNNGKNGEVEDSIDIYPELIVSRLPASTISEADAMINRILSYETNPSLQNWENRILMSGSALYDTIYYKNGVAFSDAEYKGSQIYNNYISPFWTGQRICFYDTNTDFPLGGDHVLNSTNLQTELQKGYNFFYMDTHGSSYSWQLEKYNNRSHYSYYTSNANTLNNIGNTFIITSACNTNHLDQSVCLSKAFMKNPTSGILGYFGSSRYGWFIKPLYLLGPSNQINATLMKTLFLSKNPCFAEAAQYAKTYYGLNNPSYSYVYRWLLFALNPLCDPEMPVYIDNPRHIDGVGISYLNGNVIVTTSDSCKVCITNKDVNTSDYFEVRKGNHNVFSNMNGCYNICITKPGYIPYIATLYTSDYIQDETIEGNTFILSENGVQIGRNVTTSKPEGAVSVENGKTIIQSSNGVVIKNDFEVKPGAEFEIR